MNYLDIPVKELKSRGGFYTAKEISSQPDLWLKTYSRLVKEKDQISKFLNKVLNKECPNIILTGAGTSAFIGEALVGPYQKKWKINTRAISTTNIITHPEDYFMRSRPTLLISFARSGDSPESLATVELAEEYCDDLYKLNITCNKNGELALRTKGNNSYVFLLPEETNDKSLAMTSSFTSMLLSGLLILNIGELENIFPVVQKIQEFGSRILKKYLADLKKLTELKYDRMVFLGSGPLFGAAHESHLKVQELSNGMVICTYDSFMGFRHGPRAVVNNSTIVAYLLSNDPFVRQYEYDLINAVNETSSGAKFIAIGSNFDAKKLHIDFPIKFPADLSKIPEEFLSVFYVLPAQIMGCYKSLNLGLAPDSPSESGSITRVVQGVKIYFRTAAKRNKTHSDINGKKVSPVVASKLR
jgi:tagatose-6-phosphate ketose/aldose isomerase